jgi:hypothetical protein
MIDFVNDEHKEMHDVLLGQGFEYFANPDWIGQTYIYNFSYRNDDLNLRVIHAPWTDGESKLLVSKGSNVNELIKIPLETFKEVTKYFTTQSVA